jgi:hypothetical protein
MGVGEDDEHGKENALTSTSIPYMHGVSCSTDPVFSTGHWIRSLNMFFLPGLFFKKKTR